MLYNSLKFLLFFPAAVVLYYLTPCKWRHLVLLALNYFFYMCFAPIYGLLLLAVTLVTYAAGRGIEDHRRSVEEGKHLRLKKHPAGFGWMLTGVLLCLGALFVFKYYHFFVDDMLSGIQAVFPEWKITSPALSLALPVGISFYTFQSLGYVFDVYKGKTAAERNILYYAAFVSFFPLLCAGPIERGERMLPQLREPREMDLHRMKRGLYLMLWGYFQKMVISDRCAILVNQVFGNYRAYAGFQLVAAAVLFAFQIYGDFAGYSNLAIGTAEVMGFEVMNNFNTPYFSRSIAEFWRRWHISLSSWFRDYLYFPLGGSRCSKAKRYRNIMIVFLVSGLWHGAGWTFLIWGGLNGLFQVIGAQFASQRKKIKEVLHIREDSLGYTAFQMLLTFCLVDLTWIFFNAADVRTAFGFIARMCSTLSLSSLFGGALFQLGLSAVEMHILAAALLVQFGVSLCTYRGITVRDVLCGQGFVIQDVVALVGIFVVLIFGIYGPAYNAANFIYMQF